MRVSKSSKYKITSSQVIGRGKIVNVKYLKLMRMYFKVHPEKGSIGYRILFYFKPV